MKGNAANFRSVIFIIDDVMLMHVIMSMIRQKLMDVCVRLLFVECEDEESGENCYNH